MVLLLRPPRRLLRELVLSGGLGAALGVEMQELGTRAALVHDGDLEVGAPGRRRLRLRPPGGATRKRRRWRSRCQRTLGGSLPLRLRGEAREVGEGWRGVRGPHDKDSRLGDAAPRLAEPRHPARRGGGGAASRLLQRAEGRWLVAGVTTRHQGGAAGLGLDGVARGAPLTTGRSQMRTKSRQAFAWVSRAARWRGDPWASRAAAAAPRGSL